MITGVITLIKTVRLEKLIFFFLMLAAAVLAVIFVINPGFAGKTAVFTAGNKNSPILVIDAGHGGEDGGAVSSSGVRESSINLDIALKMASLSDLTGIDYTMTRDSEKIAYPESANSIARKKVYDQKKRAELINKTPNAVLISVHQNIFPHQSVFGPQTFYSKNDDSNVLAKLIQKTMNTDICPGSRRVAAPIAQNIFLFKNTSCPAVLIECGFLSNPREENLLSNDGYRLKMAVALTAAYMQYLNTNTND